MENLVRNRKWTWRRIRVGLVMGITMFTLPLLYSNCAAQHTDGSSSAASTAASQFFNCSLTGQQQLFQLTYQPFLQTNCSQCHVVGGMAPTADAFADPNATTAFNAFSAVGYLEVGTRAVDPNHHPPYTGTQNVPQINSLQSQWIQGTAELAQCGSNQPTTFVSDAYSKQRTWSISKPVWNTSKGMPSANDIGTPQVIDWDLSNDMLPSPIGTCAATNNATGCWPSLPGAHFELTVTAAINGNETDYQLSKPTIVYPQPDGSAVDFHVNSILIKVNGQVVINETTFGYVDADARNNTTTQLSYGAMVNLTDIRASDLVSVSFGQIQTEVLPPPPPAPTVSFTTASDSVLKPNGFPSSPVAKAAQIHLSSPVDYFTTINYTIGGTAVPPTATITVPNQAGKTDTIPSNLIDYQITSNGGGTIVLVPNTQDATIGISVLPNDRYENSGKGTSVVFNITKVDLGTMAGNIGTGTYTLNIQESNSAPALGEVTLQQLLSPGGAFFQNCIECHHPDPVSLQPLNQYSMTDYTSLMSRNHFIPKDPTDSVAWQRITNNLPTAPQMPAGGLLSQGAAGQQAYNDIYNWIMNGAKNN